MKRICLTTVIVLTAVALAGWAKAQLFQPKMKKANELLQKQALLKVNQQLLAQATPDSTHIVVSIPKQRAYLMVGDQIVADGPISSGKRGHETPRGHVGELVPDYGSFEELLIFLMRLETARATQ